MLSKGWTSYRIFLLLIGNVLIILYIYHVQELELPLVMPFIANTSCDSVLSVDELLHKHGYRSKTNADGSLHAWTTREKLPPKSYAVLSCASQSNNMFAFYLPMTIQAWKRINYDSIVILTGDISKWQNQALQLVLEVLLNMRVDIAFITTDSSHEVILSQVGRLFVANFLEWEDESQTTLVTSDADLWPLNRDLYRLSVGKAVKLVNSNCCGTFTRNNRQYQMIPMCNVVMNVATWRAVMNPHNDMPRSTADILRYISNDLGLKAQLDKNTGSVWYADQIIISMRLTKWIEGRRHLVAYRPRWTALDRIDRSGWKTSFFSWKNDAHLLRDPLNNGTWQRLNDLLTLMYTNYVDQWSFYRSRFISCMT